MKNLFKIKNIAQYILMIAIFTLLPLVIFTLVSSKNSIFLGFRSFVVLTGSMTPLIPVGSVVYSKVEKDYQKGDVISFQKDSVIVTHRIVDVLDENNKSISPLVTPIGIQSKPTQIFYKTQGDANNTPDSELVPQKKVIGEALFHFPYIGVLILFLKTLPGFLIAVVLPTVIFIGLELWKIKGEMEKNLERKFEKRMGLS